MNKTIFAALAVLLGTTFAATADHTAKDEDIFISPYLGCYAKSDVENLLHQGKFVAVSEGKGPDGKTHELWINTDGYVTTVSVKSSDQLCVLNVTKHTKLKETSTVLSTFFKDLVK